MKKILSLIAILCTSIISFCGCSSSNTPMAVGKKINKDLNNLYNTVNNLDTIDNSYIANPDIYQLEDIANSTNSSPTTVSKTIAEIEQNEAKKLILTNNETTNMNDNSIQSYINGNINEIDHDDVSNRLVESTNNNPSDNLINQIKNDKLNNEENNDNKNLDKIEDASTSNIDIVFEEEVDDIDNLSDVLIIDENGDGTILDNEGNEITDTEDIPNETLDQIYNDTVNSNELTNEQKIKVYQFLFDDIRYTPRYATNYNTNIAQTTLNNYIYKVQELYTMTADVVEANNILSNEKDELLTNIELIKTTNSKMINGQLIPNSQQLVALNNYSQDIKTTIKRIKDTNGQLNNEVNNISTSSASYGLSKSVDIINSNYLKILNHIDARITYFKSALATLDQIEYILNEVELNINYDDLNLDNSDRKNDYSVTEKTTNIDTYKNNINQNNNELNNSKNNNKSKIDKNIDTFYNNLKNDKNDTVSGIYDNNCIVDDNNDIVNDFNYATNVNNDNGAITNQNQYLPNNTNNINAPNGTFQNGIITQNNLNNGVNNGVNGMYSGYANGYGNVDYFKQNNMNRTNENINTYGRNTLIDLINNGTVNNGINTLELKETNNKPVMVDSNNFNNKESSIVNDNIQIDDDQLTNTLSNNIENNLTDNINSDNTNKKSKISNDNTIL